MSDTQNEPWWIDTADDWVMVGPILSEQNLLTPDEEAESIAHKMALAEAREEAMLDEEEENDDGEDELT